MILRELLLALGSLVVLSLPLWPAIIEALWPSDEEPLTISRFQLQDPRGDFKQVAWRYCVMFGIEEPGQLFAWLRKQLAGELAPGVFHLAAGGVVPLDFGGTDLLSSKGVLCLSATGRSGMRLFSAEDLLVGEGSDAFEAHSGGLLHLDPDSRLLWWGTGSTIRLGRGAQALGALRAQKEIVLESGSSFLYLRAPKISAGSGARLPETELEDTDRISVAPRGTRVPRAQRHVFESDHEIAAGETLHGDLIVRGDLRVADGARIHGSIKSHGTIELSEGVQVTGSVVATVGVRIGKGVQVGGCVLGEAWVSLGSGSRVGKAMSPVTVSAETVQMVAGAEVHGMIRAWKGGLVVES